MVRRSLWLAPLVVALTVGARADDAAPADSLTPAAEDKPAEAAAGPEETRTWAQFKQGVKDAVHGIGEGARNVGHAFRDGAKEVGHGARDVGKKIGAGAKEAGHKTGETAGEAGHKIGEGARELGQKAKEATR